MARGASPETIDRYVEGLREACRHHLEIADTTSGIRFIYIFTCSMYFIDNMVIANSIM